MTKLEIEAKIAYWKETLAWAKKQNRRYKRLVDEVHDFRIYAHLKSEGLCNFEAMEGYWEEKYRETVATLHHTRTILTYLELLLDKTE